MFVNSKIVEFCAIVIIGYLVVIPCCWASNNSENGGGQCIWYGVCKKYMDFTVFPFTEKNLYCPYNGPAKQLHESALNALNVYCSHLNRGANTYTCCDIEQIEVMNSNIKKAEMLIKKCPSCFYNFIQPICEMTCSPHQTTFMTVETIDRDSPESAEYVTNVTISVTYDFINATYMSCAQVRGILDFGLSIETLCDEEAPDCTPEKLFEHIGDVENNPYVPFQISYVTEPLPGKIPFNRATVACNESPYPDGDRCRCADCEQSCSVTENANLIQ